MSHFLLKGVTCKIITLWHYGIAGRVGHHPKASVFEEFGLWLKNQLFLQIAALNSAFISSVAAALSAACYINKSSIIGSPNEVQQSLMVLSVHTDVEWKNI